VQDDGIGFVWEETQHAPIRPGQTSGFGLIGLKARVEKLGGMLTIESAPGEGTTLAVALPVLPERAEEKA
jgi:signal transduction histidine kinase